MYLDDFIKSAPHIVINQLSCDSRVPMKDCIFFCIKGIKYNGHDYVKEAISNGANVIVYSDEIDFNQNAIFIRVNNVDDVLKSISNKFYDYPASKLDTYVISGTNGRSSVSMIINQLLSSIKKCSSIGVFGINYGDNNLLSNQPTLTLLDNQKTLRKFVDEGVEVTTFEASSLSLSFKKLDAVKPNAFIYTSTSLDDQEYNELGNNYFEYLVRYLYTLEDNSFIVLNSDDISYDYLKKASGANCVSYGFKEDADYYICNEQINNDSSSFVLRHAGQSFVVKTKLVGLVNIYNLVGALAALNETGYNLQMLIDFANNLEYIDGIMNRLKYDDFNIYVDCAHSPDSYRLVLEYGNSITKNANRLISIISINTTDNDHRLKELLKAVEKYSDLIILTEDDTYEDDIVETMEHATKYISNCKYLLIEDREEAIEEAIELLNKDDTLMILGKGNENFLYKGLVKKDYIGDKPLAYKYLNKRLKEEKNTFYFE